MAAVVGIGAACGGAATGQRESVPMQADESILPLVTARHVTVAEATTEAAATGLVAQPLEVPLEGSGGTADLIADYFARANELGAHVTAGLALEAVTVADGVATACRTVIEPEVITRTMHVPARTRQITVDTPVVRRDKTCVEHREGEPDSAVYETTCTEEIRPDPRGGTGTELSRECHARIAAASRVHEKVRETCTYGPRKPISGNVVTEEIPAHDDTTTHHGFRALDPVCEPAVSGAEPSTRITGTIYVAR